jgi:hypothetical protein
MLIAGTVVYPRTARSPCKPLDVVIVQGFLGDFANPWPHANRICGASAASGKFRKNILTTCPRHACQFAGGQAARTARCTAAFVLS